ncbi:MAG TPA: NAD-dependent epimerase/dehydratase family protein [Thermoanaerobaculia bacterium]|nr:NAD-dependent epimerase/dehydratase family protein [Thermoanaerobaculia bacterium]
MQIVVIGGTRFVGPKLVKALERAGHTVTVVHRATQRCPYSTHIHDSRANLAKHNLKADVVVDTHAMTEQDAQDLLAADIAPRVVVLSSGDVYRQFDLLLGRETGAPEPTPLTEDAALRTQLYPHRHMAKSESDMPYWYDKILVERAVMQHPGATVLRLPVVYGPGDYQHRFGLWISEMDKHATSISMPEGQDQWRWSRAFVDNAADAIALAATNDKAAGRTYNIAEPDALTDHQWLELFARTIGWHGLVNLAKDVKEAENIHWQYDLTLDSTRIREELGYRERVQRMEALVRTVEWERSQR